MEKRIKDLEGTVKVLIESTGSLIDFVKQSELNRIKDFQIVNENFQKLSNKFDTLDAKVTLHHSGTEKGFVKTEKGLTDGFEKIHNELQKIQTTLRYEDLYKNMQVIK